MSATELTDEQALELANVATLWTLFPFRFGGSAEAEELDLEEGEAIGGGLAFLELPEELLREDVLEERFADHWAGALELLNVGRDEAILRGWIESSDAPGAIEGLAWSSSGRTALAQAGAGEEVTGVGPEIDWWGEVLEPSLEEVPEVVGGAARTVISGAAKGLSLALPGWVKIGLVLLAVGAGYLIVRRLGGS